MISANDRGYGVEAPQLASEREFNPLRFKSVAFRKTGKVPTPHETVSSLSRELTYPPPSPPPGWHLDAGNYMSSTHPGLIPGFADITCLTRFLKVLNWYLLRYDSSNLVFWIL